MRVAMAAVAVVISAGCGVLQQPLDAPANRRMLSTSLAFAHGHQWPCSPSLACLEARFPVHDLGFFAVVGGAVLGKGEYYDPPSGASTQYDFDGYTLHLKYGVSVSVAEFTEEGHRFLLDLVASASLGFIHVDMETERGGTSAGDANDGALWDMRCGIALRPPSGKWGVEVSFILQELTIELFQGAMTDFAGFGPSLAFNLSF